MVKISCSLPVAAGCCRYEVIARYLLDRLPTTQVVMLAILPRGYGGPQQPSCFTAGIDAANAALK